MIITLISILHTALSTPLRQLARRRRHRLTTTTKTTGDSFVLGAAQLCMPRSMHRSSTAHLPIQTSACAHPRIHPVRGSALEGIMVEARLVQINTQINKRTNVRRLFVSLDLLTTGFFTGKSGSRISCVRCIYTLASTALGVDTLGVVWMRTGPFRIGDTLPPPQLPSQVPSISVGKWMERMD